MVQIVLTPEQTRLVLDADAPILVVSSQGAAVGKIDPPGDATRYFTAAEIAAIEARIGNDGPYVTTAEMLASLSAQGARQCE